ncbi:MAG: hypothetical protein VX768_02865, partial [Planctomycetota bacterium]|nr:hypothetical protein [Planctomycetota bacterium]
GNAIRVAAIGYNDLGGNFTSATGVGATGTGTLEQLRLVGEGIRLHQRVITNNLVLETTDGVSQFDTVTTDGLIETANFSLSGSGFADLTEANLIGNLFASGDAAIDFDGDVRLRSLFGIDFDTVTFTFQDATTRDDSGVRIGAEGGQAGNLELTTGGDITDAGNIDISVAGIASLIADNGSGDIVLGDAFSTGLGSNNVTNFGSVGLKAFNATVHEDSDMALDGTDLGGNLVVSAYGDISQTGNDPFSAVGTSALQIQGSSSFVVDNDTLPGDHFNDSQGRDVLLMARDNDELIDNQFSGTVTISGTANTGGLNGSGTVRNVQFRNAAFEVSAFPTINNFADPLKNLTVWVPNSSAFIGQSLEVLNNVSVFAGVDAVNGKVAGSLDVTNALLNRRITDANNSQINVGNNAVFESGNTIILANSATDSLVVGNRLQTSTHGGDAGSRVRVGVANSGSRGTDSGANVEVGQLRFRAKPTILDDSEHATFHIDSDVEIYGPNVARSLMLIADGSISDDMDADINVKNSTTLVAENGNDIILGESFSTNFINNNVHNLGLLAVRGHNATIAEDSAVTIDAIQLSGNLDLTAMGNIRQVGKDRFGQIGTSFIEVAGDATFRVDQQQLPADQLNDTIGQDVKIMANQAKQLMDNVIDGEIVITSTDVDNTFNRKGSVRNVEIRNTSANAKDPIFNLANSDKVRNLQLWVTNASLNFRNDFTVLNNFNAYAGVDSVNGLRNGRLAIVDNNMVRDITDSTGVQLDVRRNLDFRAANHLLLGDSASDSVTVDNRASLITLGGSQGNRIELGTDPMGVRGNDSGATVDLNLLKYRAPLAGNFGMVTIAADGPVTVTADSSAQDAMVIS